MTDYDITVRLPKTLFDQLQSRAARRQRTVAEEVLDVLTGASPVTDALPDELEDVLAQLDHLDDAVLWQMVQSRIPNDSAERLEELNLKLQREGLTSSEREESDQLVQAVERSMLVRAKALALLHQRDHDVSDIGASA